MSHTSRSEDDSLDPSVVRRIDGQGKAADARRYLAAAKKQRPKVSEAHYHDRWSYEVLLREAESLIRVPMGRTP